jgi:chemotaxis protein CheD
MDKRISAPVSPARPVIDVFLKPGEYFVGDAAHRIRTLLGSCVSMTLWSPRRRVGAMSHFLLAQRGRALRAGENLDGRYGDEALQLMLVQLAVLEVQAGECQAKIFGGGEMFPGQPSRVIGIGRRNGEAARDLLQQQGIEVVSESLFGAGHRQIVFDVAKGHVWARQIRPRSDVPPSSSFS